MELENIVANTVLLKAREGKDGDGGFDSSSLPVPYRHSTGMPPDMGDRNCYCTSSWPVIKSFDAAGQYAQDVTLQNTRRSLERTDRRTELNFKFQQFKVFWPIRERKNELYHV